MSKKRFIQSIVLICIFWGVSAYMILSFDLDETKIVLYKGILSDASCEVDRTTNALMAEVIHSKNKSNIFMPLKLEIICDDTLINNIKGKQILWESYQDIVLGVQVGNQVLLDKKNSMKVYKDPWFHLFFLSSIAILIISLLTKRYLHQNKRGR